MIVDCDHYMLQFLHSPSAQALIPAFAHQLASYYHTFHPYQYLELYALCQVVITDQQSALLQDQVLYVLGKKIQWLRKHYFPVVPLALTLDCNLELRVLCVDGNQRDYYGALQPQLPLSDYYYPRTASAVGNFIFKVTDQFEVWRETDKPNRQTWRRSRIQAMSTLRHWEDPYNGDPLLLVNFEGQAFITTEDYEHQTKLNCPEPLAHVVGQEFHAWFVGRSGQFYGLGSNEYNQVVADDKWTGDELTLIPFQAEAVPSRTFGLLSQN